MAWNTKFPPAAFFEEFDAFIDGGGKRLFNSYLAETEHRRLLERRAQLFPFIVDLTARSFALFVAGGVLAVAVIAMYQQAYWLAALFGGGVIGAVINAFLRRLLASLLRLRSPRPRDAVGRAQRIDPRGTALLRLRQIAELYRVPRGVARVPGIERPPARKRLIRGDGSGGGRFTVAPAVDLCMAVFRSVSNKGRITAAPPRIPAAHGFVIRNIQRFTPFNLSVEQAPGRRSAARRH